MWKIKSSSSQRPIQSRRRSQTLSTPNPTAVHRPQRTSSSLIKLRKRGQASFYTRRWKVESKTENKAWPEAEWDYSWQLVKVHECVFWKVIFECVKLGFYEWKIVLESVWKVKILDRFSIRNWSQFCHEYLTNEPFLAEFDEISGALASDFAVDFKRKSVDGELVRTNIRRKQVSELNQNSRHRSTSLRRTRVATRRQPEKLFLRDDQRRGSNSS